MDKLTLKQKRILDFIEKHRVENTYPPTLKEIGDNFGITIGTVQDHIYALQKKDILKEKKILQEDSV